MADLNVSMILRLVDRATGPIKGVIGQVQALTKATARADLGRLADRASGLRDAQRGAMLEAAALGFGLSQALRPAIAFESAMADVAKVVSFTAEDGVARLASDLGDLSTQIPLTAGQLAQIAAAAGQANVVDAMLPDEEKRRQLSAFVADAARMATAFDISAEEAGAKMAGLRNIFALNQDGVIGLSDAVNHLSNNMAAAAPPMLNVLERTGSTAKLFGLAGEQTAALGAAFLALQTPPEVAGTAINALLLKLATAPQQGAKFQDALGRLNVSAEELKTAIGDDAQGALLGFLELLSREDDKLGILADLFGAEYSDDIAKLVGGLDQYRSALGMVARESDYAGSMTGEFEARAATTENALQLTQNRLGRLAVVVGSVMLPALNELLDTLAPVIDQAAAWAEQNPELVRGILMAVAGLVAFKLVAASSLWLFGGMASGALKAAEGALMLGRGLRAVVPVLSMVGRGAMLLFANPIGLAVAAVAAAAYLLYANWDHVKAWFGDMWEALKTMFHGAAQVLQGIVDGDFGAVVDGLKAIFMGWFEWLDGMFMGLPRKILGAVEGMTDMLPSWLGAGEGEIPQDGGPGAAGPGGPLTGAGVMIDRRPPAALAAPPVVQGGAVTVNVAPSPGMDEAALARLVRAEIERLTDGGGDMHDGAMRAGLGG